MADTGQRVGDYEIIAQLGAGGMGRVFKVRNVISNREEAMKILLPDFASDPDLAARFMSEIRTLAGLDHPGIAQLHTAFAYNNQFVMVMEFVEGITLEKLASQVRIPLDHTLDYSLQVLAALNYAHAKGVTHRDIKPANIMITTHGVVKLMDFGIAKSSGEMQLTRPGSTLGSVFYMSPEQIQGETVDGRSDIYSYGVTLYELLTGRKPFQADTSYTVLNAQLHQAPTPPVELNPDIPTPLNSIVLRALAKKPEDRFQSADEFRIALHKLKESASAAAPQPAASGQPAPSAQRFTAPPTGWETQPPASFSPAAQSGPQPASATYSDSQPPPFTPVLMPPPPLVTSRPRRGLWIGLGAVIAVLAVAAVAWLLPRMLSTSASQKPPVVTTPSPATPASEPVSPPPEPSSSSQSEPAASPEPSTALPKPSAAGSAKSPRADREPANQDASAPHRPVGSRPPYVSPAQNSSAAANPQTAASATPLPSGPSQQELREARERFADLQARSDAALAGVEQIRSQQHDQGLDIRGDILAAMNRLHHQLDEARQALSQGDLQTANEFMNRANGDTERLEKFLGR